MYAARRDFLTSRLPVDWWDARAIDNLLPEAQEPKSWIVRLPGLTRESVPRAGVGYRRVTTCVQGDGTGVVDQPAHPQLGNGDGG